MGKSLLKNKRAAYLAKAGFLFAAYFATARSGLLIAPVQRFATLVWPPSGIALAILVLQGVELWPGIFLGAFLVNKAIGAPFWVAAGIGAGNTLEALLGACLLRRFGKFQNSLGRLQDVLALMGLAALLSTLVSASVGVLSLMGGGVIAPSTASAAWIAWWIGDMLGDLIVAPLVLAWMTAPPLRIPWKPTRIAEAALMIALLILGSWVVFFDFLVSPLKSAPTLHLVFPGLIWAALRFGQRGATLTTFLVASIAIWGTARGLGPFGGGSHSENLLFLQLFMGVVSALVLILSATASQSAQALRAREDILSIVSHDLRNPLSSIQLAVDLGTRNDKVNRQMLLDRIGRSATQMGSLIGDLLAAGKIEGERLAIEFRAEHANALLTEACEMFRALAIEKGLELKIDPPHLLPQVLCERDHILRVFSNLIGNALKFTPPQGTIRVSARDSAGHVLFGVSDNGPGITDTELTHVFDRYWQARKTAKHGTGLGLFIAKGIIEAHGGRIWAQSTPGTGAAFYFTLRKAPEGSDRKASELSFYP